MTPTVTYRSKILVVSSQRLIHDGYITVELGISEKHPVPTIRDVGPWSNYSGNRSHVVDLGQQAICPALINAHTHLEFSNLNSPITSPDGTFAGWIREVVGMRFRKAKELDSSALQADRRKAIENGQLESEKAGVVALGDIVTQPQVNTATGLYKVEFLEMLGLRRDRAEQSFLWATEVLERLPQPNQALSPHAPYSTSTWLYRQAADYARRHQLPLATHLAETREEQELLQHRSGPLVELFRELGVWEPEEIQTHSFQQMIQLLANNQDVLLVHGNYLSPTDWKAIPKSANWTVVYCPQTHKHFGHEPHPWPEMLRDGINVALGTDSRASSNCLDLWQDFQIACHSRPEIHPQQLLPLVTENAARALKLDHRWGSLEAGKNAAILTIPLIGPTENTQQFWEQLPECLPTTAN